MLKVYPSSSFLIHLWKSVVGAYLNVFLGKLKNCTLIKRCWMSNI